MSARSTAMTSTSKERYWYSHDSWHGGWPIKMFTGTAVSVGGAMTTIQDHSMCIPQTTVVVVFFFVAPGLLWM